MTSTQLGTDSVIEGKILDGAVTGDKLGSGSVTAGKLSGVGGNGTSGQVLSSTGSGGFAWADDEDTTYAADESTVTLSADNKFSVKDLGVTSTQLGTDSVIEGKILDGGRNRGQTWFRISDGGQAVRRRWKRNVRTGAVVHWKRRFRLGRR